MPEATETLAGIDILIVIMYMLGVFVLGTGSCCMVYSRFVQEVR